MRKAIPITRAEAKSGHESALDLMTTHNARVIKYAIAEPDDVGINEMTIHPMAPER